MLRPAIIRLLLARCFLTTAQAVASLLLFELILLWWWAPYMFSAFLRLSWVWGIYGIFSNDPVFTLFGRNSVDLKSLNGFSYGNKDEFPPLLSWSLLKSWLSASEVAPAGLCVKRIAMLVFACYELFMNFCSVDLDSLSLFVFVKYGDMSTSIWPEIFYLERIWVLPLCYGFAFGKPNWIFALDPPWTCREKPLRVLRIDLLLVFSFGLKSP